MRTAIPPLYHDDYRAGVYATEESRDMQYSRKDDSQKQICSMTERAVHALGSCSSKGLTARQQNSAAMLSKEAL